MRDQIARACLFVGHVELKLRPEMPIRGKVNSKKGSFVKRITMSAAVALMTVLCPAHADELGDAALGLSQLTVSAGPAPPLEIVSGTALNKAGRRLGLVTLTFKLYDASGAVIGTALAQTSNLDAGETWRYQAIATIPFATVKLGDISVH